MIGLLRSSFATGIASTRATSAAMTNPARAQGVSTYACSTQYSPRSRLLNTY